MEKCEEEGRYDRVKRRKENNNYLGRKNDKYGK